MKKKRILLIDDDESLRRIVEFNLTEDGYEVVSAADGITGFNLFKNENFDLVIADIRMPGMDGIDLLNRIKTISYDAIVIIITAHGTIESAIEAMKLGAFDFITKPFSKNQLSIIVKKAFEYGRLMEENRNLRRMVQDRYSFENIVGKSQSMEALYRSITRVAMVDSSVLISGESGTGKELFARAIHFNSSRAQEPFITVNCSAIPEHLFESELFGHRKGAFTGAVSDKVGKFEAADGGTIFLDEIAEIPLHLQSKILRVLQEGEIDKIGWVHPIKVDVRVISATNRKLEKLVSENKFREDLYYRLNIVPLHIPPLRERKDDIPLLADYFMRKFSERFGKVGLHLEKETFKYFEKHDWLGNVRELENTIERLVVMSQGNSIKAEDLPDNMLHPKVESEGIVGSLPKEGVALDEIERDVIRKALELNSWNQSKTASFLKISRQTLLYRMKKHKIG
ncbi:MAG: sigma-54 dependent transcriptional regulator [Acidobacteriota bacterium]